MFYWLVVAGILIVVIILFGALRMQQERKRSSAEMRRYVRRHYREGHQPWEYQPPGTAWPIRPIPSRLLLRLTSMPVQQGTSVLQEGPQQPALNIFQIAVRFIQFVDLIAQLAQKLCPLDGALDHQQELGIVPW